MLEDQRGLAASHVGVGVGVDDLYGFRTSLTIRHRDMVDEQPRPATVSRWSIQRFPESDSDVAACVTVEIRLRAVTAVNDSAPVSEVAERYGVTRQTVTAWRKRYEAGGLDAQSRRPHSSPASHNRGPITRAQIYWTTNGSPHRRAVSIAAPQ
jgi:hypothetical protein